VASSLSIVIEYVCTSSSLGAARQVLRGTIAFRTALHRAYCSSNGITIMTSFAKELLSYFPRSRAVFAYGSGAFQQPGLYSASGGSRATPMLDIIFAADNPIAWHHEASTEPRVSSQPLHVLL